MIGAGSVVFCKTLVQDILLFPEFAECEFALMDIDPERLWVSEKMAHKVAEATKTNPTIKAYSDRRAALDGADYCINMIQVGGYKPGTLIDFEVPKKYGLKQTIGDTLGIGGIFRSLRTIPVMLDMCRDMEELCPNVQFLNYTNPMGINTGAMLRGTKIRTVGLCHGIQGASHTLARYAEIPYEELTFIAAGTNHCSWFIKLQHNGKDLYPLIIEKARKGELPEIDQVRIEMMLRLGYFGGESPEHLSEYLPYFIRRDRPDLLEKFHVPIDEYLRRCEKEIVWWEQH
jgi:alpha-galactosidase